MQLTIFTSIALLCGAVIAAPPQRREASVLKARQSLADVNVGMTFHMRRWLAIVNTTP